MQLDHDQLHRLLDRLEESDIQEFRLEGDDFRLEVRRNLPTAACRRQSHGPAGDHSADGGHVLPRPRPWRTLLR